MLQNVVLGWIKRRIPDWGGWLGIVGTVIFGVLDAYSRLSPAAQDVINEALQGNWKTLTLGGIASVVSVVWSQRASFKATVQPQVVAPDGTKAPLPALDPSTRAKVQIDVANKKIDAKKAAPTESGFRFPNPFDWFVDRG